MFSYIRIVSFRTVSCWHPGCNVSAEKILEEYQTNVLFIESVSFMKPGFASGIHTNLSSVEEYIGRCPHFFDVVFFNSPPLFSQLRKPGCACYTERRNTKLKVRQVLWYCDCWDRGREDWSQIRRQQKSVSIYQFSSLSTSWRHLCSSCSVRRTRGTASWSLWAWAEE